MARFVVIGDATLDVTVRGPRPVPGSDREATISFGPGGQGANVAVRLARRGASVCLLTALGRDWAGRLLEERMAAEGVEVANLGGEHTGVVLVSLDDGSGERAMLSDRVSLGIAGPTESSREAIAEADWIHVSGYPLADGATGAALGKLVGSRRDDQRASVGGGSFGPAAQPVAVLRAAAPDLVLFDRAEADAVVEDGGAAASQRSASELAAIVAERLGAIAIVTDGPAGSAVAAPDGAWQTSGSPRPQVDATGAGDAYAAAVIGALAGGPWPPSADDLRSALEEGAALGAEVAGLVGAQARAASEVES